MVAFDLPVDTAEQRKTYYWFRKKILENHGFLPLQKSLYYRWCHSADHAQTLKEKLHENIPPSGSVLVMDFPEGVGNKAIYIKDTQEKKPLTAPKDFELF